MLTILPIISSPITAGDVRNAFRHTGKKRAGEDFCAAFSAFMRLQHVYATNSGISSFYLILETLKELSPGKEVVLPAYTAGSLVVAVKKAGLVPILCDISKEDAGLDIGSLAGAVSKNTLAVVGVHAFGIAMKGIREIKRKLPEDVFFVEDCAQSFGTAVGEQLTGSYGDVSFFSFNRGKNMPLCGSGCIATNNKKIAAALELKIKNLGETGASSAASAFFAVLSLS
ncbi:MAG: DegT/DnrJ/EryC1/StrS family aminotransferase, partial [Candidatus Omnitrophica bacterium]|nr:DegT/DnrJ/EryC1/StrS family aminotransferase [Candidatus Omnitrophota bacterium]